MTPEQQARLDACLEEAARILYADTTEEMQTLEDIERVVRGHLLNKVGPEIGHFLSEQLHKRKRDERGDSKAALES
jgi:tagatose-1,6-bisphosphate aldolase non-catalytic subunit AgaZ/GatZ